MTASMRQHENGLKGTEKHIQQVQCNTLAEGNQMAKVNSEKLKKMFKEKNLMQVSISRALGFSDNYISSRLSEGEIQDDRLEKICMVLNISPESVKLEKDPKKTDGGGNNVAGQRYYFIYLRCREDSNRLASGNKRIA